jgi:nucleoside-diphosphate-sugar epimerase
MSSEYRTLPPTSPEKHATGTLIVGTGYVGLRVAELLRDRDPSEPVHTVTRSPKKAESLAAQGFHPVIADWTDRRTLAHLPPCRRVLVAVSYDPRGGKTREESQVGGLGNLLDHLHAEADIVYLSSTGVFHQTDGSWVDESSPARPAGAGGWAHLRAEELLHRRRPHGRWTILRLAGIYGPGRVPRGKEVRSGRPVEGPQSGYLNLIHREDAARAVLAAWDQPENRHRLYLVSDDVPVVRAEFYRQVARTLGVAPPTFTADANSKLSARSLSNKRIWNRRLRRHLLRELSFPDYVRGLTDSLKSGTMT